MAGPAPGCQPLPLPHAAAQALPKAHSPHCPRLCLAGGASTGISTTATLMISWGDCNTGWVTGSAHAAVNPLHTLLMLGRRAAGQRPPGAPEKGSCPRASNQLEERRCHRPAELVNDSRRSAGQCDSRTAPLPPQFPIPNPQILLFRMIESIKARPRIFKQPADMFISAD